MICGLFGDYGDVPSMPLVLGDFALGEMALGDRHFDIRPLLFCRMSRTVFRHSVSIASRNT